MKPVTIVGAGIAGLTVALCLEKHSIPTQIIEKRKSITTAGAGIQITPNAFKVLDMLGLGAALKASSHSLNNLSVFKAQSGKAITRMPLGRDFEQGHGAPYLVLKRQALLDILAQQATAQGITIDFDTKYTASDKKTGGIIIGADGVWSKVREDVNGISASFSGRSAFRAQISAKKVKPAINDLCMWLGNKAHFVAYPVDEAGTLNLVCVIKSPALENRWSTPVSPDEVLDHLKGWNEHCTQLVRFGENWQRWPLYTISPRQPWSRDNKVLIGDAAHAMLPFLAQGGAMAIEDAATLAHSIVNSTDMGDAFATFQSSREARISRVWNEAKANGERYHWSGIMAEMRDLGLKTIGGKRLQQRYDWIYNWKPPQIIK